jgi:hypothetical protein
MKKVITWNFLIIGKFIKIIENHQSTNSQKYLILILINVEKMNCITQNMIFHHLQSWTKLNHMIKISQ